MVVSINNIVQPAVAHYHIQFRSSVETCRKLFFKRFLAAQLRFSVSGGLLKW